MTAAVFRRKGEVSIEQVPAPRPEPGEVLLEISHCGVCGSDIHFYTEGWGQPGSIEGHEYTGRIAALGEGVTGFQIGDPIVGGPGIRCGTCQYCQAGRPSLCAARDTPGMGGSWQGAFARYKTIEASQALRLPEGVSLRVAALTEPLAVALHAITRAELTADMRILITGAGPIGTLILSALRAKGIENVTVSEPAPVRQELARRLGAVDVVHPESLPSFTNPGEVRPDGFHVVFEASGQAAAQEQALAQVRRGGTLMLVGAGAKAPRWNANRILLNEIWVSGSFVYDEGGFHDALELLASGRMPVDLLIEPGDVTLDGLWDAVVDLHEGRVAGKVMIVPETTGTAETTETRRPS